MIGVDPSSGMLDVAREKAPENVTYVEGSSFDLSFIDRPLDLVTFGRSFHFMDRDATLQELDKRVVQGGAVAFFGAAPCTKKGEPHAWFRAMEAYFRKGAVMTEEDKEMFGPNRVRDEFILARSAFSEMRSYGIFRTQKWTYKRVLRYVQSHSIATKEKLGADWPAFEKGLKKTLRKFGPGPWETLNHHKVLIARRP